MKRIIEGVTYNTDTAIEIAYSWKKDSKDKYVTLYQTRKGDFFFHIQNYESSLGHIDENYDDPKRFIEIADEVYINPFSSAEKEMQRETAVFVRLPEPLKRAMETAAKAQGVSVNHWIVRRVEEGLRMTNAEAVPVTAPAEDRGKTKPQPAANVEAPKGDRARPLTPLQQRAAHRMAERARFNMTRPMTIFDTRRLQQDSSEPVAKVKGRRRTKE